MKTLVKKMPDSFNIFLFGDRHVGSYGFFEKGFAKMIGLMEDEYDGIQPKHNFGLDHGDNIEAITIDDKRFDLLSTKEASILAQLAEDRKLLKPIASRLIALLDGNHPRKLHRFGEITEEQCSQLGVPFGSYTCRISYVAKDGSLIFKHYAAHGFRSINSTLDDEELRVARMRNTLKRILRRKAGDCLLMTMGHTHKLLVKKPDDFLYLYTEGKKFREGYTGSLDFNNSFFVPENHRWYGNTGTFRRSLMEGKTDYGEMAGYDPIELGLLVAKVRDRELVDLEEVRV